MATSSSSSSDQLADTSTAPTFGVFGSYAEVEDDSFLSKSHSLLPGDGNGTRRGNKKRQRTSEMPGTAAPKRLKQIRSRGVDVSVSLEFPSPYGIRPEGCALLDSLEHGVKPVRTRGAMGPFVGLTDDLMLYLLGFLGGEELAQLSAASRPLYVFAHHPDLWRSLLLHQFRGDWKHSQDWKTTFVNATLQKRTQAVAASGGGNGSSSAVQEHVHRPIAVKGFYSDLLFKHHACCASEIPPEWYAHDTIPRVSAKQLTVEQFIERFEKPNIPCIITDLVTEWPAFTKWQMPLLAARHGQARFHCGGLTMTLADYFHYVSDVSGKDDRPLYLFERSWLEAAPDMEAEFSVPPYFVDDLTRYLGDDRPDWRWMIAGPRKSGSTL